jgi:hypothetical protein
MGAEGSGYRIARFDPLPEFPIETPAFEEHTAFEFHDLRVSSVADCVPLLRSCMSSESRDGTDLKSL